VAVGREGKGRTSFPTGCSARSVLLPLLGKRKDKPKERSNKE